MLYLTFTFFSLPRCFLCGFDRSCLLTMSRKHRIAPRLPNLPGPIFDSAAVEQFLIAYGDDRNPLPETVKVLDEIVTE